MKKAFLFGAFGMLVVLGFVFFFANYGQAGLTDTKTSITVSKGDNLILGTKEIVYNKIWETYKPIEVKSATDEVLFKGAIVEHTAQCGSECHSVVEIYKEKDGILIDDLYLNDEQGNRLNIKPNVEISNTFKDVEVIDYKEECTTTELKNGTKVNDCSQVKSGSHIVKEPIYEKYVLGSSVKAGNYLIKPSATFNLNGWESKTYDWIMVVDGQTLNSWATWTAGLNSGLFSYYNFNNVITDDVSSVGDLTTGGSTNGTAWLGSGGRLYDGSNDKDTRSATGVPTGAGARTYGGWINLIADGGANENPIFSYGTYSATQLNVMDINGGKLRFWGHSADLTGTTTINTGTWYFVVATYDGTTLRTWVNGLNDGNLTTTLNTGTTNAPNFGYFVSGGYANILIDEFFMYNRSLSGSEIIQLYNEGNGMTYTTVFDRDCAFNGSVKTNSGVAVNGARVVITNVNTDTVVSNTTTDANGLWNKNVTLSGNYSVYAYIPNNKTGGGDIKTYVECIRPSV